MYPFTLIFSNYLSNRMQEAEFLRRKKTKKQHCWGGSSASPFLCAMLFNLQTCALAGRMPALLLLFARLLSNTFETAHAWSQVAQQNSPFHFVLFAQGGVPSIYLLQQSQ